jgi:hypothetical protein
MKIIEHPTVFSRDDFKMDLMETSGVGMISRWI